LVVWCGISEEFYDLQAEHRRYFYYIDLQVSTCHGTNAWDGSSFSLLAALAQGRLFLEDTRPKNIATSLKSAKFLHFFFSQVQRNLSGADDPELAPLLEYPFKSPCGKEMNFIKCADRPFVLDSLVRSEASDGEWLFTYGGGGLTMPLQPETLRVSISTGRLYHDVKTRHVSPGTPEGTALVRSQLAVELAKHMEINDAFGNVTDDQVKDGPVVIGEFEWESKRYPVRAME
jgi:hypothetical protein